MMLERRDGYVRDAAKSAATLLIILGLVGLSLFRPRLPDVVPASAGAEEFSAIRAMEQLGVIAKEPHPVGTPAHDTVRVFILGEITKLGVQPEIQETTVINERWGTPFNAARVRNIVARLQGTEGGKAVLLMGHYDSVPTSPGASDDGHSVALILEILRALQAGAPLGKDVIFLMTDAEEAGLLGAKAFVEEHPWAKDVGMVLNFEARGTGGLSILFETSPDNGRLIREFARVSPSPFASSLASAVYEWMPNDTDFTVFKEAGYAGLNFAFIDEVVRYHTWLDNLENLDLRSLQHQGSNALALTRHFGNSRLEDSRQADLVYFNIPGYGLASYPSGWARPLAFVGLFLFLGVLALGMARGVLRLGAVAAAFALFLISLLSAAAIGFVIWRLILLVQAPAAAMYASDPVMVGLICLATAGFAGLYVRLRRRIGTFSLAIGALFCWLGLALLTGIYMPGGSYLFIWPLLFGLIGSGIQILFLQGRSEFAAFSGWHTLFAAPGLVLFPPVIFTVYVAMTITLASVSLVLLGLLLGLLIPQLAMLARPHRWGLPAMLTPLGLLLVVVGIATSGFDEQRCKPNTVFYFLDSDAGEAFWGSLDRAPDDWTSQFLTSAPERDSLEGIFPFMRGNYLKQATEALNLPPPHLEVLEDRRSGKNRILRMRVTSPRGAPNCFVFLASENPVHRASVNGKAMDLSKALDGLKAIQRRARAISAPWGLYFRSLDRKGLELELETTAAVPLEILLIDQSYDVPQVPNLYARERPRTMMPSPRLADSTFVRASFTP